MQQRVADLERVRLHRVLERLVLPGITVEGDVDLRDFGTLAWIDIDDDTLVILVGIASGEFGVVVTECLKGLLRPVSHYAVEAFASRLAVGFELGKHIDDIVRRRPAQSLHGGIQRPDVPRGRQPKADQSHPQDIDMRRDLDLKHRLNLRRAVDQRRW